MQPAIAAVVVILLCLAGAFGPLSARRSQTNESIRSRPPLWQAAVLCSVALGVAVAALSHYWHG
jgi:hypothetical protein